MSYSSEVLADSPWGMWALTESSPASSFADSSGNARHLDVSGTVPALTTGPAGGISAQAWPSSSGAASTSATYTQPTTATYSVWLKMSAYPSSETGVMAFGGNQTFGYGPTSAVSITTDGKVKFALYPGSDASLYSAPLTTDAWHHVVCKVGTGGAKIRVNKVDAASSAVASVSSFVQGSFYLREDGPFNASGSSALTLAFPAAWMSRVSDARTDAHYDAMYDAGPVGTVSTALPALQSVAAGAYVHPPLSGSLAALLPGFTASVAGQGPIVGSFAATLPSLDALFTSGDYALSLGDVSDARHRGGVGYATWIPAVVPTPSLLASSQSAVDVAFAFGPVMVVGTQPTFAVTTSAVPRHRDRVIVGGRDVTYFRGAEVRVGNYQLMEPFGYGTATLEFPQVYPEYEAIGEGDLAWLAPQSKVLIQRVDSEGNVVSTDYRGYLIAPNANTGTFTYEVGGEVTGPAALRWRPMPLFRTVEDIGRQIARALGFLQVRTPRLGPDTGIEIARVGGMTLLEHMQQLIGRAWTRDGNQWTVMPDEDGVYRTARKDRATVDGTVYLSATSAEADLRRDISEEPNRIFATGVTPAGKRVRFGRYPGLDISGNPPAFPGNLSAGDTGDGVLALIRQLQVQGYLNAETAPGQYDADVTKAIREVQDDADLTVTGNVNAATWDAIFDNTSQGVSLKLSRIEPAAQKRYTKQYRYSASGAIKGRNPFYDPTRLKIDRSVDFGTGFTQEQMREWSKAELVEGGEPNWVGTLTIHSGAIVAGDHTPGDPISEILPARDIRPGMNLSLPQFQGGIVVHVTAAQVSGDVVTLQVDTRARDAWNVAQVIERNRESRRDPARAFFRELASSKVQKDAIEEWSEVGGLIPDQELTAGWNVLEVVAGQAGTVRSIRFETNPNAESSVAVFRKRVWPKALQRLVGDPLSAEGSERWADDSVRRKLERDHGLLYAAGDQTDPGGYSPGAKSGTSSIFTGRFEDDASFAYYTDNRPILFVAVYVDRDCTIPGGRIMWPQLESGA